MVPRESPFGQPGSNGAAGRGTPDDRAEWVKPETRKYDSPRCNGHPGQRPQRKIDGVFWAASWCRVSRTLFDHSRTSSFCFMRGVAGGDPQAWLAEMVGEPKGKGGERMKCCWTLSDPRGYVRGPNGDAGED